MRSLALPLFLAWALLPGAAVAAENWRPVSDPDEVRALIVARVLVTYKTRQQYHRSDGAMIVFFSDYESYAIRRWKVREDGKLCWMIFGDPGRLIDCAAIQRGSGGALRYKWENAQGAPPLETPDIDASHLIAELTAMAGDAN